MLMKKNVSYKVALFGMLGALALTLSYLESLLPTAAFLPPGAKPGFSNVVNMFAAGAMGFLPAISIAVLKACFAGVTRGVTAFFMSLCGGLLSTCGMFILFHKAKKVGYVGIGVISAVLHNAGQLLVASVLVGNRSVLGYMPILLLSALVTGFLTGSLLKAVMPQLLKVLPAAVRGEKKTTSVHKGKGK